MIPQRLTFITLGVKNLDVMKRFYKEQFGWETLLDRDGVVFFKLNGIVLGLFPEQELAEEARVKQDGKGFKRFSLSINMESEAEVDKVMAELNNKGVRILKKAEKVFWGGYNGYVADAEENLWEFAYNPFLLQDQQGNVQAHQ